MFSSVVLRESAAQFLAEHPTLRVIHDAAGNSERPRDPDNLASLASLAAALDEPFEHRTPEEADTGAERVRCVMLGGPHDGDTLTDAEWAAIARHVATAAGLEPTDNQEGTRWAALRSPSGWNTFLVASVIGHDGRYRRVDGDALDRICERTSRLLRRQDYESPGPDDRPGSLTHVTIRDYPSGVAHAWGGDELATRLLERAGFRRVVPLLTARLPAGTSGHGRWRTPFGITQAERAHLTSAAVTMLRATGYFVDYDDDLFVRPDVTPLAPTMADPIGAAGELLYYCNTADEGAALADQVLGRDGVLDRVHEFMHSLTAWADYRLDASDLAARLNDATDAVFAVMADMLPVPDEVRAHAQDPDTPPEFHTQQTRAATTTTTASPPAPRRSTATTTPGKAEPTTSPGSPRRAR